ncbi:MAG: DUF167 domain-containing protein [Alphaproteobacteria bacterium]|nr:DUF167 domain-containing protein [Alphaproteobacteria bacterium]MBU1517119.1 DUF167 domain-containing protein [Alphaproteobacteria bacterium]MBU2153940.1 DUF167 domain-containing protein [Alphaproteobacteria bacterium]MBU2308662.1 DUF167 domain-containing protein [Alphaproteobacteria bacterium]MBU2365952.1 DUF167 domain-containing protein [Alphaproteobacteria bacterium]
MTRLTVRVAPRGGRDAVEGWMLDEAGRPVLKLRVSAAAAEGAANAAVVVLLAKALKLPKSAVRIASGETARVKRLEIEGAEPADLARAFGPEPDLRSDG